VASEREPVDGWVFWVSTGERARLQRVSLPMLRALLAEQGLHLVDAREKAEQAALLEGLTAERDHYRRIVVETRAESAKAVLDACAAMALCDDQYAIVKAELARREGERIECPCCKLCGSDAHHHYRVSLGPLELWLDPS